MLDRPEVVHFQQVLNAYGSKAVFAWLKRASIAARVVTVHELDTDQLEFPQTNEMYNQADAVLVHCEEMKQRLMQLGVQREIIHVVLHGTWVPSTHPPSAKQGVVFYGGHKLMSGKGIETVFNAMSIIRERRPEKLPLLKIHGHYGSVTPAEAIRLAERSGVADNIVWLNQIPDNEMVHLYHGSLLCVLPYTGSFAGLAAAAAAACQIPIVCTRKAGLPDHLGDDGVWVDENNPQQLAARMLELLDDESLRDEIGARLLKRAQDYLSWDVVADQIIKIYEQVIQKRVNPA